MNELSIAYRLKVLTPFWADADPIQIESLPNPSRPRPKGSFHLVKIFATATKIQSNETNNLIHELGPSINFCQSKAMLKYRLRSLLFMIFVAAILMAWLSVHLQKRYEDQVQRSSFSALTTKATDFQFLWRDKIRAKKGLEFDSNHFSDLLATSSVNPYFRSTTTYKSSNHAVSKWKTVVRMESHMGSYPSDHELRLEYQAQDMNQELLATVKEHFEDEDVTITFVEISADPAP